MIKIRLLGDASKESDLVNTLFNHLDKIRNDLNLDIVVDNSLVLYYEIVSHFQSFENESEVYSDLNVSDILMKKFFVSDLQLILSSFPDYRFQYDSKKSLFLIYHKNNKKAIF